MPIYLSTTYLQKPVCVIYGTHIVYSIFIFIKGITFQLLPRLRWKAKEKLVLDFGLHLKLDLINFFNIALLLFNKIITSYTFATSERCALGVGKVKPFFCFNVFTKEKWTVSHF